MTKNKPTIEETMEMLGYERDLENDNIEGYIYFLEASNGLTKIGITTKLKNRISQLRSTIPIRTRLAFVFESASINEGEKIIHEFFEDKRKKGEWFELSAVDYLDLIDWMGEMCTPTETKISELNIDP